MDYQSLETLRRRHPAWRLLAADHAPLIVSFLHRSFIAPNLRSPAAPDLVSRLENLLHDLQARLGDEAFPLKQEQAREQRTECEALLQATTQAIKDQQFPRLQALRPLALGEHTLTVESCDSREKDMREWLQARIDAEDQKLVRLAERIIKAKL